MTGGAPPLASVLSDFGDALDFIVNKQESRAGGTEVGGTQLLGLLGDHLLISGASLLLGIAIALPLGLWLGHTGRGTFIPIGVANVGRAVPSLALIVFFVAYLGTGFVNVMFALALLAIPPVLANAYTGVRQADRDAVDAARGMGLSGWRIVRDVELPLALPLVFGGIRTSAVNVVATATIAPLAGVSSLGDPIISFGVYGDAGRLGGSIVVALLAVATELSLAAAQRAVTPTPLKRRTPAVKHRTLFALLGLFACMLALSACGDDEETSSTGTGGGEAAQTQESGERQTAIQRDPANAQTTITVGSKNFTEQRLLGEIYAQGLEAAGFRTETELNLGDERTAQRALERGTIDGYPEYTGTALLSLCDVPTDEIPNDPQQAFQRTRECFAEDDLTAFPPTPFTSSNEVGVKEEVAERNGLRRISDLARVDQDFTLYGSPECRQRTDCLLGLRQTYDLDFRRFVPVSIDLRHDVLDRGENVASIVFTTDPQNRREGIRLLEDDRGMFPPYNSTFVVRNEIAQQGGEALQRTIEQVQRGLTDEVMQELNARVDIDREEVRDVARAYLRESGLVAG
jgi:glycine betaine/choline ABC-type transport system substrate-binding protein/ABC-type proline/glycine betaine transport system permease subunit